MGAFRDCGPVKRSRRLGAHFSSARLYSQRVSSSMRSLPFSRARKLQSAPQTYLPLAQLHSYSGIERTNGEIIVKHSLKTAALSFGIAMLFGGAVALADSTDTSSSKSSQTTTDSSPPPAVVYAAPVVAAPAPVYVAPAAMPPSTTTSDHSSSSSNSNDSSPGGDSNSEHSSHSSTSNY